MNVAPARGSSPLRAAPVCLGDRAGEPQAVAGRADAAHATLEDIVAGGDPRGRHRPPRSRCCRLGVRRRSRRFRGGARSRRGCARPAGPWSDRRRGAPLCVTRHSGLRERQEHIESTSTGRIESTSGSESSRSMSRPAGEASRSTAHESLAEASAVRPLGERVPAPPRASQLVRGSRRGARRRHPAPARRSGRAPTRRRPARSRRRIRRSARARLVGRPAVAERDERVSSQPARIVPRHVEAVELRHELRTVALQPVDERDRRRRPSESSPRRRFSTPRFHGQTSWQMSQP